MLGICVTSLLRYYGCDVVAVVDVRSARLKMAKNFGATHTFNLTEVSTDQINDELLALTNQYGVDWVVEVIGVASAFTANLDWLWIGGHYLTLGYAYPEAAAIIPGDAIEFVQETRHQYSFQSPDW